MFAQVAVRTHLHLTEQFAYLAVVLDAYSRTVIGWALELHLRASVADDALKTAISARVSMLGSLIHHSVREFNTLVTAIPTSSSAWDPAEFESGGQSA